MRSATEKLQRAKTITGKSQCTEQQQLQNWSYDWVAFLSAVDKIERTMPLPL